MQTLNELRNNIDKIDRAIISLLHERLIEVEKVGRLKKRNSIPPLDTNRWREVLQSRITIGKQLNCSEKLITDIFNSIHEEALSIEEKIIHEK